MTTESVNKVYDILDELKIPYNKYEHNPVYTSEEANELNLPLKEKHCKNLFVRNAKGNVHYLVVLIDSKKVDLKKLSEQIGSTKLSFASAERLDKYLGLKPGSVGPFGLINDSEKSVKVVLDKDLASLEEINIHPNVNTGTVTITYGDLQKFIEWCGNSVSYVQI